MKEGLLAVPAAAQRPRSCALGAHLDAFCAWLADLGYRRHPTLDGTNLFIATCFVDGPPPNLCPYFLLPTLPPEPTQTLS